MQSVLYIAVTIFLFGVLIAVHELGHFLSAKALGVKVNEFAIGMGPKLLRRQGKETEYTLRLFPIGGFCAMEGEDEESSDPHAFGAAARWRQFIILIAGSATNFLAGLLILLFLLMPARTIVLPSVEEALPQTPAAEMLEPGDRILSVDGHRVLTRMGMSYLFARSRDGAVTLEVERGGERMALAAQLTESEEGWKIGIVLTQAESNVWLNLRQCFLTAVDYVRIVWWGLTDLLTGRVGLRELSGPIGIVGSVGTITAEAETVGAGIAQIFGFMSLIAVNLAVMNLLPIPALDGGRILFLLVGGVFTAITKRKLNPKYEAYINAAGLICLLILMAVVAVSDVVKLL